MSSLTTGKHSRACALRMGYEEFPDEKAYGGAYYIKDGLKWIFTIGGLKKYLGIYNDDELRSENYDVDTYYRIESESESESEPESDDDDMKSLYHNLAMEDGQPVYLEGGMYLYPDGSIR